MEQWSSPKQENQPTKTIHHLNYLCATQEVIACFKKNLTGQVLRTQIRYLHLSLNIFAHTLSHSPYFHLFCLYINMPMLLQTDRLTQIRFFFLTTYSPFYSENTKKFLQETAENWLPASCIKQRSSYLSRTWDFPSPSKY